jgi:hypothetical protein
MTDWLTLLQIDPEDLLVGGALGVSDLGVSDLGIGGNTIGDAAPESVQVCEWATYERHLIWLIGEYPVYSETQVDT